MIQRLYRLLLLFCSIAVFAACSDSDGNDNNGGNGGEIVPDGGDTYGYVTGANGNPVPGVVVSDGFTCTQTDAEGQYVLTRNAESGFVFYSLPSGYKVNMHKTYKLPKFFTKLKPETARYDFTLTALDAPETRFDLICIGDPQINEAAHAVRFKREAAKDIREYSSSADIPCYAIHLGDLVNNKWALYSNMVVALQPEQTGIPVFSTIGNHDHEFPTANEKEARAKYESFFGPVDYSFNRGDVHVVCMDDVIYTSGTEYTNGFTDAQLAWLRADLSFVPKQKMVILCYHIPLRSGTARNMAAVKALLSEYAEAHLMAAHTHYNENFINTDADGGLYEHIHGAPCGVFWHSALNGDGTPNGYAVYDVEGAAITDWRYKSSLHDESFQIRLHRGGDTHSGFTYPYTPKTVIANVWNADPEWRVTLCENGVETKAMTLVTTYTDAWSVGYHVGVLGRGDNYKSPCKHMYVAEPNDVRAALKVVAVDRWGNRYEQSEFTAPDDFTDARSPVY